MIHPRTRMRAQQWENKARFVTQGMFWVESKKKKKKGKKGGKKGKASPFILQATEGS